MPEFQLYLDALARHYDKWWNLYTLTDAEGRQKQESVPLFDFGLMAQTIGSKEEPELGDRAQTKIERFPVTEGLQKYAIDHVLLVGRPGSGKSTALARLMLDLVKEEQIPVLVELRSYQSSILELIRSAFKRHDLSLTIAEIETLLDDRRLILLIDGVNELPSELARTDLSNFRRNHSKVPMIFTTRDLGLGGDLGIEKKLEMQPLTEKQMRSFIHAYLPGKADAMLGQLRDRLREFGTTPLLLWMLCEVFDQAPNEKLPNNLAGIFRVFTRMYEESSIQKYEVAVLKGDVQPLSDRRLWKPALKHLASVMMQGKKPIDFRVELRRIEAEEVLREAFPNEIFPIRDLLDDLLKYHLLQNKTPEIIEFRHQLIQEYYAAEWLLERIGQLDDETLECDYLNYLKWKEPLALMLALVDEEKFAVRMVDRGLSVDLMLGARLAGEARSEFQEKTIQALHQETPGKYSLFFLKKQFTNRPQEVRTIDNRNKNIGNFNDENIDIDSLTKIVRNPIFGAEFHKATKSLSTIDPEKVASILLKIAKDVKQDKEVRYNAIQGLKFSNCQSSITGLIDLLEDTGEHICFVTINSLGYLCAQEAIPPLLKMLENSPIYYKILESLEHISFQSNEENRTLIVEKLLEILNNNPETQLSESVVKALGTIKAKSAIPILIEMLHHNCDDHDFQCIIICALGEIGAVNVIDDLICLLSRSLSQIEHCKSWNINFDDDEKDILTSLSILRSPFGQVLSSLPDQDKEIIVALGKLGASKAIPLLWKAVDCFDLHIAKEAFQAIQYIQLDCKFYNYEIYRKTIDRKPPAKARGTPEVLAGIAQDVKQIRSHQMTEPSRTFNIHGNYIEKNEGGYHEYNYAPESKTQPTEQLTNLLAQLRTKYPDKTDSEIFDILLKGFDAMPQNNPQNWQRWQDIFSVLFSGGVEATKILVPVAGIPLEILKRLYEIYDRTQA